MAEQRDGAGSKEDARERKLKEDLKQELKVELLKEIYAELKSEKSEKVDVATTTKDTVLHIKEHLPKMEVPPATPIAVAAPSTSSTPATPSPPQERITLTAKVFLKIAAHALKYANNGIPREKWVEVIGLLAGKLDNNGAVLHVEDAYPMGHGNAVYAEIKEYKNFVRAYNDLRGQGLFVAGWYHSHPAYGLFLSDEDMGTQARYQKLWDKSIALVIDPYQINGTSFGFNIFRANLKTRKWFPVPFSFKNELDTKVIPELVEFINPIVDGKALFMEYDQG
ncbi:MAG: hypothetical protein Q6373_004415 [Candidatus Sigynarchaeota archaeon]